MKLRLIAAAAPFAVFVGICAAAGSAAAGSQTSVYYSTGPADTDADLQAAARVCDWRFGVVQNGSPTPQAYKDCMLAQGWSYGYTVASRHRHGHTYPDPDNPGLVCHDITVFGIVGSSCSNY